MSALSPADRTGSLLLPIDPSFEIAWLEHDGEIIAPPTLAPASTAIRLIEFQPCPIERVSLRIRYDAVATHLRTDAHLLANEAQLSVVDLNAGLKSVHSANSGRTDQGERPSHLRRTRRDFAFGDDDEQHC